MPKQSRRKKKKKQINENIWMWGEKSSPPSLEHRASCWLLCLAACGAVRKGLDASQTGRAVSCQRVRTLFPNVQFFYAPPTKSNHIVQTSTIPLVLEGGGLMKIFKCTERGEGPHLAGGTKLSFRLQCFCWMFVPHECLMEIMFMQFLHVEVHVKYNLHL